jgi:hypothetical protein|tara:strand:- start:418 stop:597 length:180 start_codon:yes stop_codon:yes gene_type:complete
MNISVELINAILSYLSKRPFNEVNGLVGQLMLEARQEQESGQQELSLTEEGDDEDNVTD